jgi:hypothetical protein
MGNGSDVPGLALGRSPSVGRAAKGLRFIFRVIPLSALLGQPLKMPARVPNSGAICWAERKHAGDE